MTALDIPRHLSRAVPPLALTLALTLTLVLVPAAGATAAPARRPPPDNDTVAGALLLPGVPARVVQDSSRATSARGDGRCVRGASVWYRYRPTSSRRVRVTTVGSDFDTLLAVFRGPPARRRLLACSDDMGDFTSAVDVRLPAGRSYWIAVSACCTPDQPGGRSVLRLHLPRPAAIAVGVAGAAAGAVSGRLLLSGTYRCATPSVGYVEVAVSQRIGLRVARGTGLRELTSCDGRRRPWSMRVDSDTGWAFQEGRASVTVLRGAFDGFTSQEAERTTTVTVGTDAQQGRRR